RMRIRVKLERSSSASPKSYPRYYRTLSRSAPCRMRRRSERMSSKNMTSCSLKKTMGQSRDDLCLHRSLARTLAQTRDQASAPNDDRSDLWVLREAKRLNYPGACDILQTTTVWRKSMELTDSL